MKYMEQSQLPIKTKIVAWIIIGIVIVNFLGFPFLFFVFYSPGPFLYPLVLIFNLFALLVFEGFKYIFILLFFTAGIFLLFRKKLAWWLAIVQLIILLIFWLINLNDMITNLLRCFISLPIILLILLILDQKKFFKIAS